MEIKKRCGCICNNCIDGTIRKCKKCNFEGIADGYFYKTGYKKKNNKFGYQSICKKCYTKRNNENRDKELEHYENDFDNLPEDVKIKIVLLRLETTNIKYIAKTVKCKYNMLWYANRARQIEKFSKYYIRINPNNKYGLRMRE
tara:strand:- start:738 stop:1166 length:429 start_codon:yes stop_codon:yes gene_type:complete